MPDDVDVIIVGGGPVGVFAALLLAKREGLRVCVLSRDRAVYFAPRAVVLDAESMRLFRCVDLELQQWMQAHVGPNLERELSQKAGCRNGYPGQPLTWWIAGGPEYYGPPNEGMPGLEPRSVPSSTTQAALTLPSTSTLHFRTARVPPVLAVGR